jgi:preprotein translocase subunit SecA
MFSVRNVTSLAELTTSCAVVLGRQGDPGSSQFFVSLDDDLMRIFGSEKIASIMNTLRLPDDVPIENAMISRSLESAQKKVEGHNFDIRKHLVSTMT